MVLLLLRVARRDLDYRSSSDVKLLYIRAATAARWPVDAIEYERTKLRGGKLRYMYRYYLFVLRLL